MSEQPDTHSAPKSAPRAPHGLRLIEGGSSALTTGGPEGGARELPHSDEAEEALLACCLLDGADTLARCERERLAPAAFYKRQNQVLFAALLDLRKRGLPIDVVVLAEELKSAGKLEEVGGYGYLTQVSGRLPTTAQMPYFVERVLLLWVLRAAITKAAGMAEDLYAFKDDGAALARRLEEHIAKLQDARERVLGGAETAADRHAANLEKSRRAAAGDVDRSRWLFTGFKGYDDLCGPLDILNNQHLILLAAERGVGKSSVMRQWCGAWARQGKAGLVFSLEMANKVWMEMLAAQLAGVARPGRVRLPADQEARYLAALEEAYAFVGQTLWVDDDGLTLEQMIARADEHLRKGLPLDYVVVDILSSVKSSVAMQQRMKRMEEVEHIARALQAWAKRRKIPVFLIVHFNRGPSSDQRRPRLSDLRDSGALENMADVVLFLHKPHKLPNGEEQDESTNRPVVEFGALKNKVEKTDCVWLSFDGAKTLFRELSAAEVAMVESSGGPKQEGGGWRAAAAQGGGAGKNKYL